MLSLIPYFDFRRAAFRSVKHMSKLCVLLSLNQHLLTILDIDSLCGFLLQLSALQVVEDGGRGLGHGGGLDSAGHTILYVFEIFPAFRCLVLF